MRRRRLYSERPISIMFVRSSVRPSVCPRIFLSLFLNHFWCRLTNRKRVSKGVRIDLKNDQKHAFFEKQSSFCNRKPLKKQLSQIYKVHVKLENAKNYNKLIIHFTHFSRVAWIWVSWPTPFLSFKMSQKWCRLTNRKRIYNLVQNGVVFYVFYWIWSGY